VNTNLTDDELLRTVRNTDCGPLAERLAERLENAIDREQETRAALDALYKRLVALSEDVSYIGG